MHRAPALSFPLGRSRFQGALVVLTGLAGIAVGLFWHLALDGSGWRQALFALLWFSGFVLAFESWWHSPGGSLRWDGESWRWTGAAATLGGQIRVHLDLQFWLILSLRPDSGRRIWLCPERWRDVTHWNALRRAVFARAGADPAQPAAATARAAVPGEVSDH
jgi:hypothetical protein